MRANEEVVIMVAFLSESHCTLYLLADERAVPLGLNPERDRTAVVIRVGFTVVRLPYSSRYHRYSIIIIIIDRLLEYSIGSGVKKRIF